MNRLPVYMALIILALSNASFQWPVDNGRITATFCESRWDHFHDGVDMVAPDDRVYPVDSGKLLFYWDKTIFPMENYPGGGNYIVLQHGGEIVSIYMHLDDFISAKPVYSREEYLGTIGNTGHSFAKHLHFSLLNSKEKKSLNPLTKMPSFTDEKAPEIYDMYMKIGDRYVMIRNESDIRLTRHYPLLVKIIDTITGNEKLGVYRLAVHANDKKIMDARFDELAYSNTGLKAEGRVHDTIFDEKGYYRIEGITYQEGENRILFSAHDFSGNQAEKEFSFFVKLDLDNTQK